jgi:kynurenine formamidase
VPWDTNPLAEPFLPSVNFVTHQEGARRLASKLGFSPEQFPDAMALGWEEVNAILHVGTHVDAPLHFGPTVNGKRAKSIDEAPIELFYGDGVVLDVRHVKPLAQITVADLQVALGKIRYKLKPLDIVLIMTGFDKYINEEKYLKEQPGMSREATLWLLEQGIKVIGIDTYGFDRPFGAMAKALKDGESNPLFPAHMVGREKEYYHIEKLGNLDKIPMACNFKVACFPQNVRGGTAGAVRPVALVE